MTKAKYIVQVQDVRGLYGADRYMQRRSLELTTDRSKAGRFTKKYANSIAKQHNAAYYSHSWYGAVVVEVSE